MAPKICHLTSVHPVFDTRIFYKECRSLARNGYEVELIAQHTREEVVDSVRIIPFTPYRNRFFRILLAPIRMFRLAKRRRAAAYHFHDPELIITGVLLRLFTRSPVVYDIHEDYSKLMFEKEWLGLKVLRRAIGKIFGIFEGISSRLMSANVVVLPNWQKKYPRSVLVRNYPVIEAVEREKDENLFIYIGTIEPVRSGLAMIRIFNEVSSTYRAAKMAVIGKFDHPKYEGKIMAEINKNPGINFLGFRPYHEAKGLLAKAKYGFVLYSDIKYRENIPVKMFEYLAFHVIPIFSSFKDFKYEIESEGWGIPVDPRDPKTAARHIAAMIDNKKKLEEIDNNMKRYREKYSWKSEEKRLIRLYNEWIPII